MGDVTAVGFDDEAGDIEVEQDREVGGDGLDQLLEALGVEQEQHRGMDAVLAVQIGPAGADQLALLVLEGADLGAQPVDHEGLEVHHPTPAVDRRRGQVVDQIGVLGQEVRVAPQIGAHILRRERRRLTRGVARFAAPVGHDRSGPPYRIDWPVFFQSSTNWERPLSVSGWLNSCFSTDAGAVTTWAPRRAALTMCIGLRIEATSTSVLKAS